MEWIFKVVMKADGATVEEAEEKVFKVLDSANLEADQELNEQPYVLSYENEDGSQSGLG